MEYTLTATTVIEASPEAVFDRITDIEHLPDWNLEIPKIVELPPVLEPGTEWVVGIHAMHTHWNSRARVVQLDRAAGRFTYVSQTDDGNPSHADWRWQVNAHADGAEVTVEVDVRPRTHFRKLIAARLRRGSLRKAMQLSLETLREQVPVR
jgi:uncharacterized protein YndB with AHSA1/START domain